MREPPKMRIHLDPLPLVRFRGKDLQSSNTFRAPQQGKSTEIGVLGHPPAFGIIGLVLRNVRVPNIAQDTAAFGFVPVPIIEKMDTTFGLGNGEDLGEAPSDEHQCAVAVSLKRLDLPGVGIEQRWLITAVTVDKLSNLIAFVDVLSSVRSQNHLSDALVARCG